MDLDLFTDVGVVAGGAQASEPRQLMRR